MNDNHGGLSFPGFPSRQRADIPQGSFGNDPPPPMRTLLNKYGRFSNCGAAPERGRPYGTVATCP